MYKYRDTQKIDITPTTETGSIVSFDNTSEMVEIQNVLADIEAVQDGTPWQSSLMQVPYIFQRTPQLGHDYNSEIVNAIVGGTVAWNQRVQNGNFADGTNNWVASVSSISASGGKCTVTVTGNNGGLRQNNKSFIANHVLLFKCVGQQNGSPITIQFKGYDDWTESFSVFSDVAQTIVKPSRNTDKIFVNKGGAVAGDVYELSNIQVIDLTALFGSSTIADYLYSLEQSTAGSGIAKLKEWGFDIDSYHAYDAGSLQSVNTSAHIMRDADDNIIGNYPLDSDLTLRGIPKLDSSNNLYYDGDVYEPSGEVTRNWNTIVYNGTETGWYKHSSGRFYLGQLPSGMNASSETVRAKSCGFDYDYANTFDYSDHIFSYGSAGVYINAVSADETVDQFKARLASRPLRVVYPLVPTTETADPYTAIQTVDPYGTEEYIDYGVEQGTRDIAVPVGHQTRYALPVAISGFDEVKVYVSPTEDTEDATVYTVSLASAGTIYGGTLDVIKGELTVTHGYIESYDGETINEPWISSYDPYVSGTTPTEGAQVVYPLTTPTTYVLTQEQIEPLIGPNNIWTDTGDITVTYANNPILLNTLPTEAVSINGRYLEKTIDGYSTLYVKGRESLGIDLSTYSVGTAHGEKIKGSRYPARTLTVGFQLLCANEQEFRFRFNQLNNILSIGEADFIFHDEEDKFFTGTPIMDAAIEPGRNCVTGEWKIYCAYPFKRSVEPIVLTSEDEEGVVISGNTATFTFDYKGVMPARPLLRCAFASAKTDGDYNEDGDCGFVAFLNQDESIIQLGNPEVIDVDELNKNGTLINSEFDALTNWTPSGITVGNISDPYWAGGKGQTMAFAKGIGTLSRSTSGAVGFEFDIVHRLCVSAAAQTGAFKVSMKNGNDTVVGFIIEKTGSGTTGTVKYIVNNKVVGTDNIDLSYYNTSFGYCRRDPVYVQEAYQIWEEYQYFYYVKKKVKGKKKKVKVWATAGNWVTHTRTVQRGWRYTQSNLNSGISRDGGVVTFSIGNLADRTFKDSDIDNTACYDVVFETTGSFHTNAVRSCAFIRKAGVPFAEIPNVFTAGDVVQADCSDATVYLYRAGSTEGHLEPQYGALGNDWEDFEVKVGTNIIRAAWSDWVDEDYRPKIEIAFNEVFI